MFSVKNQYFSLRFSLSFTPTMKTHTQNGDFESGDLSGDFENGASENARVNSEDEYLNEYGGLCQPTVT